jgi:hypothetical protein
VASGVKHNKTYGDYTWWRGGNMTPIDVVIGLALPSPVSLSQGGLNGTVTASAKTHYGLGAFDVNIDGWDKEQTWLFASEGLRSGWIVFPRGFTWDTFQGRTLKDINDGNEHCHVCSRESYKQLHPQAQAQINEYLDDGGDGLIGSAGYTGPATKSDRWVNSPYNEKNIRLQKGFAVVQVDDLIGNSVDRFKRKVRAKGFEIEFEKMIKRWGRWNLVTKAGIYYALEDGGKSYTKIVEKEEPVDAPVEPAPVVAPEVPATVETYSQN